MNRLALWVAGILLSGPVAALAAGVVESSASTERSPARRIAGVWTLAPGQGITFGELGEAPPLTPRGQALFEANRASLLPGAKPLDPTMACLPMGVPRNMYTHFPIHIVETPGQVTMIFQNGIRTRRVYLDGRPHDPDSDPSYNGESVGRWEDGVLVVDTVNFKEGGWLEPSGVPRGPRARVLERIRPVDGARGLEIETTLTDPDMLEAPWVARKRYELRSGAMLEDFVCVERVRENPRWASTDGRVL